eukprot:scaffold4278_cov263-Pinguiococcus_pyrenoidosus.AAC.13
MISCRTASRQDSVEFDDRGRARFEISRFKIVLELQRSCAAYSRGNSEQLAATRHAWLTIGPKNRKFEGLSGLSTCLGHARARPRPPFEAASLQNPPGASRGLGAGDSRRKERGFRAVASGLAAFVLRGSPGPRRSAAEILLECQLST